MRRSAVFPLIFAGCIYPVLVSGQSSSAPTPQHPIDTRPEGQAKSCSYSANRSNGQTTGSSSCAPSEAGGASAARRFPYPGEVSEAPQGDKQAESSSTGSGTGAGQSTSKKFPYPGETPTQQSSPLRDAGSTGESSSSSSSSSDGALPPDDSASSPDALPAPKRARKKLPPVPRQTPDEREQEDVRIAAFYQNDGNYLAAYMRAKDAVGLADDDPEAQFALAEAARKLGKFDEAQKGYKRCLELDPVPKLRKGSEKALKEMAGS